MSDSFHLVFIVIFLNETKTLRWKMEFIFLEVDLSLSKLAACDGELPVKVEFHHFYRFK
jgi:hypothetical protein